MWLAVNGSKHPGKIMQPVLTRWQCVGECLVKFLAHVDKYVLFARKVKDTYKTGNSKCDIASDFLSLIKEKVLVTMAYFL